MKLKIAVLAGDGIGPEIMEQGVAVCSAVAEKFGHEVSYKEAICGAHAIDEVGDPFPEDTFQTCMDADAVLFASVGDPKFDNNPNAKVRPEQGLLAMRKKLGLFANVRPVTTFDCLVHKSPLKDELVRRQRLRIRHQRLQPCRGGAHLEGGLSVCPSAQKAPDGSGQGQRAGIKPSVACCGSGNGSPVSRCDNRLHVCR